MSDEFMTHLHLSLIGFAEWLEKSTRDTLIVGMTGLENLVYAVEQEIDKRIERGEWD